MLSAEVFSQDQSLDEIAIEWLKRYEEHNTNAMCDLVNFVLNCTGCDLQVDIHDIEDPDNVASKLQDLQDVYQTQKITDYPLISKGRNSTAFRATVMEFFESIITAAHASSLLYDDLVLIENIQVWVTTMSSSAIRSFRHTATVISLAIATTICNVMNETIESTAKTMRQKEGEQKKKSVNKDRVAALQGKIQQGERRKESAEGWLKEIFDGVFMHRYRDVDPKIRVECVIALGTWISTCPDLFFEGQYLRYLGWVLSDTSAPTRAEVIKQLTKLFKHKESVGRLRAFTERFRPRIVEMAAQDAESTIRASAVELLDIIRDVGLLEPNDIDTIGRLVFDTEPRVRKAVSKFFAENINDLFESTIEDLGGEEGLEEILGDEIEDDYDNPRKAWVKLKCLAEVLQSCDTEDGDEYSNGRETINTTGILISTDVGSRYSLAAQAIYERIPEVQDWEIVAGYLLYDHSSATEDDAAEDPQTALKVRCQLGEKEEVILLEILNTAVKLRLSDAIESESDKKGKKTKARKDESREIQETTALRLAQLIPRLLKKFGSSPASASAVLRLEPILNLEIFQELRQDSTEYASLLDDINKQFMTHEDRDVLAEASTALLHARSFEDLEEVTDSKVQELWSDNIAILRALSKKPKAGAEIINTILRIANLSSISNCVHVFETESRSASKSASKSPPLNVRGLLLNLMNDLAGKENSEAEAVLMNSMKAMLFYYMWKARTLRERLNGGEQLDQMPHKQGFSDALWSIIDQRAKLDNIRIAAIGALLDLHTLFATFRHAKLPQLSQDGGVLASTSIKGLIQEVSSEAQQAIESSFIAAEKTFAKKSRRALEAPSDDDPPEDLDSEPEDDSDNEGDEDDDDARRRTVLLAEKRLCELTGKIVLAIVGRVLDGSGSGKGSLRKRLLRNKVKLGANFKEVLQYLEEPKPKRSHKAKTKSKTKEVGTGKAAEKSEAIVVEDDDEDEEAQEVVEEGDDEDLQRRELAEEDAGGDSGEEERPNEAAVEAEDDIMGD